MSPQLELPAFDHIDPQCVIALDDLVAVVSDKFPISAGQALMIPRRTVARYVPDDAGERIAVVKAKGCQAVAASAKVDGFIQRHVLLKTFLPKFPRCLVTIGSRLMQGVFRLTQQCVLCGHK